MLHPKFYSGNGRLEATEIYVAAKLPGKIEKIFVEEGDVVRKGDKLVQMQTNTLEAEKASVIAKIKVQQGELAMAQASVKQKESVFTRAKKEYERQRKLISTQASSQKSFDDAETEFTRAEADLEYARASVIASEGRIAEQQAALQRIEADIDDSLLVATYDGRIQYILAREGEVLGAGGRAMNLVNLTDAYLTFFLPTNIVGQVQMGAEVKLIFDAGADYAFDAKITYIDPVAQFTPKTVETRAEREKLMFRIKANLNAELLAQYISDVKTGVPGVAWVKLDPEASWKDCPEPVCAK